MTIDYAELRRMAEDIADPQTVVELKPEFGIAVLALLDERARLMAVFEKTKRVEEISGSRTGKTPDMREMNKRWMEMVAALEACADIEPEVSQ